MADVVPPARVRELGAEVELVDVRLDEEWDASRIPGAMHIPLDSLSARAEEIDRSKPVVLYCRSGDRSGGAADALAASGWDVTSMEGGIVAWAEQDLPVEPEGGEVVAPSGLPPA